MALSFEDESDDYEVVFETGEGETLHWEFCLVHEEHFRVALDEWLVIGE